MKTRTGRKYLPEEVLPFVIFDTKAHGAQADQLGYRRDFDGDKINMSSDRLKVFARKGCKCVSCGIEGRYFVKEKHESDPVYHFNLYAVDSEGEEVLMTKDHTLCRKEGGSNSLENLQPMCFTCNAKKGCSVEPESSEQTIKIQDSKRVHSKKISRRYLPEEVLPFVVFNSKVHARRVYDGDKVNMSSATLRTFAHKGLKCSQCGIEGKFFVKVKPPHEPYYHFNLIAVTSEGKEVLMTKDHVVCRKDGGPNSLVNFQVMCAPCNLAKAHSVVPEAKVVLDSKEMTQGPLGKLLKTLLKHQYVCFSEHRNLDAKEVLTKMARGVGVPEEQIQVVLDWAAPSLA